MKNTAEQIAAKNIIKYAKKAFLRMEDANSARLAYIPEKAPYIAIFTEAGSEFAEQIEKTCHVVSRGGFEKIDEQRADTLRACYAWSRSGIQITGAGYITEPVLGEQPEQIKFFNPALLDIFPDAVLIGGAGYAGLIAHYGEYSPEKLQAYILPCRNDGTGADGGRLLRAMPYLQSLAERWQKTRDGWQAVYAK